jgi:hypothetical protein
VWQIQAFFSHWNPIRVKFYEKSNSANIHFATTKDAVAALKARQGTLFYGSQIIMDFGLVDFFVLFSFFLSLSLSLCILSLFLSFQNLLLTNSLGMFIRLFCFEQTHKRREL